MTFTSPYSPLVQSCVRGGEKCTAIAGRTFFNHAVVVWMASPSGKVASVYLTTSAVPAFDKLLIHFSNIQQSKVTKSLLTYFENKLVEFFLPYFALDYLHSPQSVPSILFRKRCGRVSTFTCFNVNHSAS